MMAFAGRHLVESTLLCLLLSALASCFRKGVAARYAVRLIGVSKFAIPSVLLASTGARIAVFWPATSWVSSAAHHVSAMVAAILGMLPSIGDGSTVSFRCIVAGWAFGSTAMFWGWLVRFRTSHYGLMPPTEEEQEAMNRATSLLGMRTPIRLRTSDGLSGPALRGIFRATVTIPRGLSERLSVSEFEAVLLHELAHARRLDNLAATFVHGLVCVFWFHPLLWSIERRLNIEREHACDEAVIACGTPPHVYATGIVKVCRFHLFEAVSGVSAMTSSDLKRRLEHILEYESSTPLLYVPRLAIAGLTFLMTMVPIAGGYCQQCVSNGQVSAATRHERSQANTCPGLRDKTLIHSCFK